MNLFREGPRVLNVGLASFAAAIAQSGGAVEQIEWAPPANGDRAAGAALARLVNNPAVEAANRNAFQSYLAAQPVLTGIGLARDAIPRMSGRLILHSGPPIAWERMCGPMQGAIIGAILFEGWAQDIEKARALAESGSIQFRTLPSSRRGRSDGRRHQSLDAGMDRARGGERQAVLQQSQ